MGAIGSFCQTLTTGDVVLQTIIKMLFRWRDWNNKASRLLTEISLAALCFWNNFLYQCPRDPQLTSCTCLGEKTCTS